MLDTRATPDAVELLGLTAPQPVDLNLLRTFLAVYRSGSLTAASHLLSISQPTVTAHVRSLEQRTGRDLFTRLPRGVEPTPFAHELMGQVAGPLDELASLEGRSSVLTGRTTPVHLAGPAELMSTRVMPALAPLVAVGVQLRVTLGLTDPLLDDLRAGRHDLVISTRRPRGASLSSTPLADEDYVLVAAPSWADRITPRIATEGACAAVHGVPLVSYAEDLPIARRYWRSVFGKQLSARAALTVPDLRAAVAAVTAGAGYSVLPRYLCAEDISAGRLVVLHEPDEAPGNVTYLVQRPGADTSPDMVRVREAILQAGRDW